VHRALNRSFVCALRRIATDFTEGRRRKKPNKQNAQLHATEIASRSNLGDHSRQLSEILPPTKRLSRPPPSRYPTLRIRSFKGRPNGRNWEQAEAESYCPRRPSATAAAGAEVSTGH
jgi:hypothetical protein